MKRDAESAGRVLGKTFDLALTRDDGWEALFAQQAKSAVRQIPPRPRFMFRPSIGIGVLVIIVIMIIIQIAYSRAGNASSATGMMMVLALPFAVIIVVMAIWGNIKDEGIRNERVEWLAHVCFNAGADVFAPRLVAAQAAAQEEAERLEAEHRAIIESRPNPPPAPQPYGVSPRGAELIVSEWMRHLGALDAEVTQYTGDGGVDVSSERWIAQVKHYEGTVGVSAIRELAGVAAVDGRGALFFTSTGYAAGSVEFAERARVALFVYSVEQGTLSPSNAFAVTLLEDGLA